MNFKHVKTPLQLQNSNNGKKVTHHTGKPTNAHLPHIIKQKNRGHSISMLYTSLRPLILILMQLMKERKDGKQLNMMF